MIYHTFVILAYKECPYLEAAVESIKNQTVASEIIIATSTPCDFTQQIANKYEVKYCVNNNGKSDGITNFNFGYEQATTKYVTLAHQDDIYESTFAEKSIAAMDKLSNPLIAFTDCFILSNGKTVKSTMRGCVKRALLFPYFFTSSVSAAFFKKAILVFGNPINFPTVTFNKHLLPDFQFSYQFYVLLDWYAWFEIAKKTGSFIYIPEKLIKYRVHDTSAAVAHLPLVQEQESSFMKYIWGDFFGAIIYSFYKINHSLKRQA